MPVYCGLKKKKQGKTKKKIGKLQVQVHLFRRKTNVKTISKKNCVVHGQRREESRISQGLRRTREGDSGTNVVI